MKYPRRFLLFAMGAIALLAAIAGITGLLKDDMGIWIAESPLGRDTRGHLDESRFYAGSGHKIASRRSRLVPRFTSK
jgi:hypothetical protein